MAKPPQLAAVTLALVLVLFAAAYGIVRGLTTDSTQASEHSTREISNKELGRMVLSKDQLPPEYAGFEANPDNGLVTTTNPDASFGAHYWGLVRGGLEQFGWESGFGVAYNDFPRTEPGVESISTEVRLYKTEDGAADNFRAGEALYTGAASSTRPNPNAQNVEVFPVEIADQAGGVDFEGTVTVIDGWSRWTAIVAFRHGRLIGNVAVDGLGVSQPEKDRLKDQVKGLAVKLNDQITAVLATGAQASIR